MKKHIIHSTLKWTYALLVAVSLLGIGCAKKSENSAPVPDAANPGADSRGVSTGYNYQAGATVDFVPESLSALTAYVAIHPVNNPTNYKLNVNVKDIGNGRFAGVLQFSYYDNSNYRNGYFESGSGTVVNPVHYRGLSEAEFNQWFTFNGKRIFHAFFEDQYGAMLLVIDDALSSADGGMPALVSGKVYFKNFQPQNCTIYLPLAVGCGKSSAKSWFIEAGPYDARTFLGPNGIVDTKSAIYPAAADGYLLLGSFSGLDTRKAFNIP